MIYVIFSKRLRKTLVEINSDKIVVNIDACVKYKVKLLDEFKFSDSFRN